MYWVLSRENKKKFNLLGSCSQPFVCTLISSITVTKSQPKIVAADSN